MKQDVGWCNRVAKRLQYVACNDVTMLQCVGLEFCVRLARRPITEERAHSCSFCTRALTFWRASSLTDYDLSTCQSKQSIVFALHAGVGSLEPKTTPRNEQRRNTGSYSTKKIRLEPSCVRRRSILSIFLFFFFFFHLALEL